MKVPRLEEGQLLIEKTPGYFVLDRAAEGILQATKWKRKENEVQKRIIVFSRPSRWAPP